MAKIFNQTDRNPVGMIAHSMLTLAQFQAINGTGWVLADGGSIAGTKYAAITGTASAPDLRGMVLRGKNNSRADGNQNPDGESALGTYQADQIVSHTHPGNYAVTNTSSGWLLNGGNNVNFFGTIANAGGNETRMKNVTVNIFIKVND